MSADAPSVVAARRRYFRWLSAAIAGYAALLVVAISVVNADGVEPVVRYAAALLPVLPALAIPAAVVRLIRDSDELQARIHLQALAIAFGVGSVLTFGYGFLQMAGAPEVSWLFVWPVYGGSWGIAAMVLSRRYGAGE